MIQLAPLQARDLAPLTLLANTPEVKDAFAFEADIVREQDVAEMLVRATPGTISRTWTILTGERVVGCISLVNMHPVQRSGEITNRVLSPGAGWLVGLKAVERGAHIGFMELGLHRIETRIHGDNRASLLLCERLKRRGLVNEGTRRQSAWRAGAWHDVVLYAILREDYQESEDADLSPIA